LSESISNFKSRIKFLSRRSWKTLEGVLEAGKRRLTGDTARAATTDPRSHHAFLQQAGALHFHDALLGCVNQEGAATNKSRLGASSRTGNTVEALIG
jgi:hypothetical protein